MIDDCLGNRIPSHQIRCLQESLFYFLQACLFIGEDLLKADRRSEDKKILKASGIISASRCFQ
jgi:hypothetical protein